MSWSSGAPPPRPPPADCPRCCWAAIHWLELRLLIRLRRLLIHPYCDCVCAWPIIIVKSVGFRRPVGGRQHWYPCLDDQELVRDPERGYPIGANGERVLSGRVMDEVGLFWLTKTVDGRHCGCIDLLLVVDNRRSKVVVVEIEIDPGKRDKPENLQQFDLLWTEDRGVETACLALILPDRIAHTRLGGKRGSGKEEEDRNEYRLSRLERMVVYVWLVLFDMRVCVFGAKQCHFASLVIR